MTIATISNEGLATIAVSAEMPGRGRAELARSEAGISGSFARKALLSVARGPAPEFPALTSRHGAVI
jgi:hypothetical protein